MPDNHISRTATIRLNDSPDVILPLFTAYGETLWVAGWNPEYVYPEDGQAITHAVWKTQHDVNDPETIWLTVKYDTEAHAVTHVNVTPDKQVTRIDIQCDAIAGGRTAAQITYTITALGEQGMQYIKQLTQAHFDHWMHAWEQAINDYLHHGEAAPH